MNKRLVFTVLLIVTFFTRFAYLSSYPVHLGHDEVTQFYDAMSVVETQKDIYGTKYPFIFQSVNDYKPPFYTYATIPFYLLFGQKDFVIRLPGAFFGILGVLGVYLLTHSIFNSRAIALSAMFFASLAPFEIFYSRKSFENGAGISLIFVGLSLLFYSLEKKRKNLAYLGTIILGLSSYTYFSHAILTPIIFMVFISLFHKKLFSRTIYLIVVFLITVIPLYLLIYKNNDSINRSRAVYITQDQKYMAFDSKTNNMLVRIIKNKKYKLHYMFTRYIDNVSVNNLFINGLNLTNLDPVDVGVLHYIYLPFLILGLAHLSRYSIGDKKILFLLIIFVISLIPAGVTFEKNSPHRIILVFSILNIVSSLGFYKFFLKLKNSDRSKKIIIAIFAIPFFVWNIVYFIYTYMVSFPIDKSDLIYFPVKGVVKYIDENRIRHSKVVFDPKMGKNEPIYIAGPHYYLAYYAGYKPEYIQTHIVYQPDRIVFDNIEIRAVNWSSEINLKNTLVIASPWSLPENIENKANIIEKVFYYNKKDIAYYIIKL